MSTITDRYIVCDLCGREWDTDKSTLAKGRQQARAHGWTQRLSPMGKRLDVCPDCAGKEVSCER